MYDPLEIILSDDCSKDKTFEIMREMTKGYTGPHSIVLNRNTVNNGIGSHANRLIEMAKGELIIFAAGDDISVPYRTHHLVKRWLDSGKIVDCIWSSVKIIDKNNKEIGEWLANDSRESPANQVKSMVPSLMGCSQATTKRLFNKFGPLPNKIVYEDRAIAFRALISGGLASEPTELVHYRIHAESVLNRTENPNISTDIANHKLHTSRKLSVFKSYKKDLHLQKETMEKNLYNKLENVIKHEIEKLNSEILISSPDISDRIKGLISICRNPHTTSKNILRYTALSINPILATASIRLYKKYIAKT